jgi:tetratricopeptide (TPR) repeat protein
VNTNWNHTEKDSFRERLKRKILDSVFWAVFIVLWTFLTQGGVGFSSEITPAAVSAGSCKELDTFFTKVNQLELRSAKLNFDRGNLYGEWEKHSEAVSDFTKVIELLPKESTADKAVYAEAYYNHGKFLACFGKKGEAEKNFLKALELDSALQQIVEDESNDFQLGISREDLAEESLPVLPLSEAFSKEIRKRVLQLEYSEDIARDLMKLATDWKCEALKQKLDLAKQDYLRKKISTKQIAEMEEGVTKKIAKSIQQTVDYEQSKFYLSNAVQKKKANCFGYSQLFYVIGNALGLSVKVVDVLECAHNDMGKEGHAVCFVYLSDGKYLLVDLTNHLQCKPFDFFEAYVKDGNCWEIKDKNNPLLLHKRIRILDYNSLLSAIYECRGYDAEQLDKLEDAISYLSKAITLEPKSATAYCIRGIVFVRSKKFIESISDFSKSIELDPQYAEAYSYRGGANYFLGKYHEALSDSNKAIELKPHEACFYFNRGLVYVKLQKNKKAKKDLQKAIALDPALKERGNKISNVGK